MSSSRFLLLPVALLLLLVSLVLSDNVDGRKNEVLVKKGDKEVDPKGYLGDTAQAKLSDPQHANIKYSGSSGGPLKGKSGSGGADRAPDNAVITVSDSTGGKAKVNDDKSKKTVDITDNANSNIKANVTDPKNAVANVKDSKGKISRVKATRLDNSDQVQINQEGDPNVYKVSGISQGDKDQNDILVENPNKAGVQEAEKSVRKGSDGQISHLGAQEANLPAGKYIPIGDTNKVIVDKSAGVKGSQSKITLGKSIGISHGVDSTSNFGSFGGDCSTTTSETQAQPCTAGPDELGNNGYKVYDDVSWTYPPSKTDSSGNPTYELPGCFIANAGIQLPKGVDKNDIGIQIVAYNQIVGTMQCDAAAECQDKTTSNQPSPPCFHCNYCAATATRKQIDFGLDSDSNYCQIAGGQRFNLTWTVCPPKQTKGNFKPFDKPLFGGEKHNTDIDMVIKLFHREKPTGSSQSRNSNVDCTGFNAILNAAQCLGGGASSNPNGLSWVLKVCRRATMSYSAQCGRLGSVGSNKGTSVNSVKGSRGNAFGGSGSQFSGIFGGRSKRRIIVWE